MAGWEKISQPLIQLKTISRRAGTSQLAVCGGAVLIPVKTSPGAAKTFINLPASVVAGDGSGSVGGASGLGGLGSIFSIINWPVHYLGKKQLTLQEKSGIILWGNTCVAESPLIIIHGLHRPGRIRRLRPFGRAPQNVVEQILRALILFLERQARGNVGVFAQS